MTSPTRLYLIRHGEVEERYQKVFGGRIDMELSPRGHDQAKSLAHHLRNVRFATIYASPMKRAQQTLAPLSGHSSQPPVTVHDLREVDFGEWTGLAWHEVHERYNISAFEWLHKLHEDIIPGAESTTKLHARVEPCVRRILNDCPGQNVAVVCHGGIVRMMLSILLELHITRMSSFDVEYASVTVVECLPHRTEVQLLNFTPWRDAL